MTPSLTEGHRIIVRDGGANDGREGIALVVGPQLAAVRLDPDPNDPWSAVAVSNPSASIEPVLVFERDQLRRLLTSADVAREVPADLGELNAACERMRAALQAIDVSEITWDRDAREVLAGVVSELLQLLQLLPIVRDVPPVIRMAVERIVRRVLP
jgi:hypothetical protein